MIVGIVLAGGASRRMGRPKALLDAGGESFLERAVSTLTAGGCDEVIVVVNSEDPEITGLVPRAGARLTFGGGVGTEQVESLRAGLRALPPGTDAVVALPVDHPLVMQAHHWLPMHRMQRDPLKLIPRIYCHRIVC